MHLLRPKLFDSLLKLLILNYVPLHLSDPILPLCAVLAQQFDVLILLLCLLVYLLNLFLFMFTLLTLLVKLLDAFDIFCVACGLGGCCCTTFFVQLECKKRLLLLSLMHRLGLIALHDGFLDCLPNVKLLQAQEVNLAAVLLFRSALFYLELSRSCAFLAHVLPTEIAPKPWILLHIEDFFAVKALLSLDARRDRAA